MTAYVEILVALLLGAAPVAVEATAYTPSCAGCSGYVAASTPATPVPAVPGVHIACPPSVPLARNGERRSFRRFLERLVWIEGLDGARLCDDRGGAIVEGRIDVLVSTRSEALSFGVRSPRAIGAYFRPEPRRNPETRTERKPR